LTEHGMMGGDKPPAHDGQEGHTPVGQETSDVMLAHDGTDRYSAIASHADLEDRLARLTVTQLRYLEARLGADTVSDAANEAGVGRTTVYHWPNGAHAEIEDLVRALRVDGALITIGREQMRRLAARSIATLARNLDARFAKDQNQAAAELLDRAGLGKTNTLKVELSRPADDSMQYIAKLQEARRSLAAAGITLPDDDDAM
jgi:hypothetical protein